MSIIEYKNVDIANITLYAVTNFPGNKIYTI